MGAWFKNTLCVVSGNEAYISRNLGDLDTPEACRAHEQTAYALLDWLGEQPCAIAHDLHPDFHSSRFASSLAAQLQIPMIAVQHHHAHIAAICAEHAIDRPLLGLALDGVGLGTDGTAWGGELLRVDGSEFRRLGHFYPLPLPGGDRAAREPWRMAAAALHELGRNDEIAGRFAHQPAAATVATMLPRNLNCPRTSSAGRLFDTAAGLLGLCDRMEFEAQAAILLENAAKTYGQIMPLNHGYTLSADGVLDFRPLLAALADCGDAGYGAALFHVTLAEGLAQWVARAALEQNIGTVALGGGCFLNGVMTHALEPALAGHGLTVMKARQLAPGDSAVALGQAWVALNQLSQGRN
jgi:hydrogenase maturation protein HypF